MMPCATCGMTFEVRRKDHRFCSARCRLKAYAQEQLAELQRIERWIQKERLRWERVSQAKPDREERRIENHEPERFSEIGAPATQGGTHPPGKRQAGGAYYLAGYAVECALKACIAKQTKRHEFPDKNRATKSWTHDLTDLVKAAGLERELNGLLKSQSQPAFMFNWVVVRDWDEASRYRRGISIQTTRDLYEAISDPNDGALQWLSRHW